MKSMTTALSLIAGSVVLVGATAGGRITPDLAYKPTPTTAPAAKARVVKVVGKDFSFDAPDVIPAGPTEFRFLNQGPSIHHMAVLQLTNGKTIDDLRAALAKPGAPPAWVKEMGGPNGAAPGVESNATMNLAPGNYALICFVDLGGPPHFTKGMVKGLRVVPSSAAAATATGKSDVTMTLFDYGFKTSAPVKPGLRTIRVYNAGKQHHEVELVALEPGKTPTDVLNWAAKMEGPPPGKPLGGIAGIAPGVSQSFSYNFSKGNYALICFLPDMKDGKPHFTHGMVQEITVK